MFYILHPRISLNLLRVSNGFITMFLVLLTSLSLYLFYVWIHFVSYMFLFMFSIFDLLLPERYFIKTNPFASVSVYNQYLFSVLIFTLIALLCSFFVVLYYFTPPFFEGGCRPRKNIEFLNSNINWCYPMLSGNIV